ncbi:MAG TPA: hypothetical protein VFG23_12110, partial [Polyangia bacterium]|nr:hypothetical protein [Polyangia bacterium]
MAIPGRASVAAMAAQGAPQAAVVAPSPAPVAAPPPRPRVKTSPPLPIAAGPPQEAAPEAVEGQPTIPLRAIAADGQSGAGLPVGGDRPQRDGWLALDGLGGR